MPSFGSSASFGIGILLKKQPILLVAACFMLLPVAHGENRRNGEICVSPNNTYTAKVDIHTSERGA
jgi:hypothetical protein